MVRGLWIGASLLLVTAGLGMLAWFTVPRIDEAVYSSIDTFQDVLARRVEAKFDPAQDEDFLVVVTEANYPIGTVLRPHSTIPIDDTACEPAAPPRSVMADNLFIPYHITANLGLTLGLSNVLPQVASAGATLDYGREMTFSVGGSTVAMLSDNALQTMRQVPLCQQLLQRGSVWLVRGYVSGQRAFVMSATHAPQVNASGLIGKFALQFDTSQSALNISDAEPKPFLQIISAIDNGISKPVSAVASEPVTPLDGSASEQPPATPRPKHHALQESLAVYQPEPALPLQQAAARSPAPVIYLQQDKQDTSGTAALLEQALREQDFRVAQVEHISHNKMPNHAQVRYFHDAEAPLAERALHTLQTHYPDAIAVHIALPAPDNQLEVWLPAANIK